MRSYTSNISTYIALVLAVVAAIMSAPSHADDVLQKLQWLLLTDTEPEMVATMGVVGEPPQLPDVAESSFADHQSPRHRGHLAFNASADSTESPVRAP